MQNHFPPCNPDGLAPEVLAQRLGPFGSWPETGLPAGFFLQPAGQAAADFYREHGWLVLHEALDRAEIENLLARTTELYRNETGEINGAVIAEPGTPDAEVLQRTFVRADGKGGCVDWNDDEQKKKAAAHTAAVGFSRSGRDAASHFPD